MEPTVIVLIVVVLLLVIGVAAAAMFMSRARRSKRIQERYGAEYDRALAETGDPRAAEAQLTEREQRYRSLDIRDLHADERERFAESWSAIQRDFVDDPVRAVHDADDLVDEIMKTRGYPVDDVDQQAADVSVEHPQVVERYREARAVRESTEQGQVDTEQQRHAVASYRELVFALIGEPERAPVATAPVRTDPEPATHGEDRRNGRPYGSQPTPEETR